MAGKMIIPKLQGRLQLTVGAPSLAGRRSQASPGKGFQTVGGKAIATCDPGEPLSPHVGPRLLLWLQGYLLWAGFPPKGW